MEQWEQIYRDPKVLRETLRYYFSLRSQAKAKPSSASLFIAIATDLENALDSLDEFEHKCVMMNCVMGFPGHEMSTKLEVSQQKIQTTIRRSLDKMVTYLNDSQHQTSL